MSFLAFDVEDSTADDLLRSSLNVWKHIAANTWNHTPFGSLRLSPSLSGMLLRRFVEKLDPLRLAEELPVEINEAFEDLRGNHFEGLNGTIFSV